MKNRNKFLLSSITMAVLAVMDQAHAQQATDSTANVTRIEITGSAIKRADAETALPVTVIKADDFAKMGYTTVADVMQSLSVNAEVNPLAASGGSVANLRGLGLARTLVLLNGQRLANEPTGDTYANLEILPMSALDRVEILRDGASSLYGSDAVAGVINFITKKSYDGLSVTAKGVSPDRSGGANEEGISIIGGKGNLENDGWSLYGTMDLHKQTTLVDGSRPEANNNNTLASIGLAKSTGSGTYAYPANIISSTPGTSVTGNPYGALQPGATNACPLPYDLPGTKNTCNNNNNTLYTEFFPAAQQETFFANGQLKLAADNTLSAQVSYGEEHRDSSKGAPMTSTGQSVPVGQTAPSMLMPYLIPGTTTPNPYYPGLGITPAVAGISTTSKQPTLTLDWQDDPAGAAISKDEQKNARISVSDVGHFHDWDYTVNVTAAKDERTLTSESGILNVIGLDADVAGGIINPFGAQSAAGAAALAGLAENGQLMRDTTSAFDSLNFTASHDLWELPGGTMASTVGGDYRHDAMHDIAPAIDAYLGSIPGRLPYDVQASRDVASLFGEIDLPITKKLDLDLAVRDDDYTDVGTTVNPKVSLRYQPLQTLTLRSAFSTGFRAPSLIDSYGYNLPSPTKTTSNKWDDPTLCDGGANYVVGKPGTGSVTGATVPGGNAAVVCNQKQSVLTGSNPALTPEKSKSFTAGFVVDPIKNLSVTVDYWHIHVTNTIGALSENTIFDSPTQYAADFIYNRNAAGVPTSLAYVNETNQNLGDTITSGEDLDVLYKLPKTTVGDFMVHLTGTYTNDYQFQTSKGSAWCQNVGQFGCGGLSLGSYSSGTNVMTFRWQHNLMLSWTDGPWSATAAEKYQSGYHDGTTVATQYYRDISSYSVVNLTGAYSGFKNLVLSAGVQNLFNRMPPVSNTQGTGLLLPYDSVVGRAYIASATYKFF